MLKSSAFIHKQPIRLSLHYMLTALYTHKLDAFLRNPVTLKVLV